MLPDFPKTKQRLIDAIEKHSRKTALDALGAFGESPLKIIHEGNSISYETTDGEIVHTKPKITSATFKISNNEIPDLSLIEVTKRATQASLELAKKQSVHIQKMFEEITRKKGNIVDMQGNFTAERYLDMLEKIPLNFDDMGNLQMDYVLQAHPETTKKMNLDYEMQRLKTEPALVNRMQKLIELKREEWRDREANRKLVG